MTGPSSTRAAAGRTRRTTARRRRTGTGILALVTSLLIVPMIAGCSAREVPSAPVAAASHAPLPATSAVPNTPEGLLADADAKAGRLDPTACAVEFSVDHAAADPQLQTQGLRFAPLPIPSRSGAVFAGWYPTAKDAATRDPLTRVNGSRLVQCTDRRLTLFGAWETPEQFRATDTRVPVLMYHQFTTAPDGVHNRLRANWIYTGSFDAQMAYIAHKHFYLPTWDELGAFIDGRLALPKLSVIITDDDAAKSWFQLGVPIVDKYKLLTTSFVITKNKTWPSPSIWVQQRSHTNDMHRPGANGKGRMVNLSAAAVAADMKKSAKILGVAQVMAYPFGDFDKTAEKGLRAAGFEMAFTTEWGLVATGANKLELPRVRMSYGMTVKDLADAIG